MDTNTMTFAAAAATAGTTVPNHLMPDDPVPVINGQQRQGDLLIVPDNPTNVQGDPVAVPPAGVQLVVGEATGNTHLLHASGTVTFHRHPADVGVDQLVVGWFTVTDGATGWVTHTDEHGTNGFPAGTWKVLRQREARSVVAD